MADYDRRPRGGGSYNNRKRRYRDDDDFDRRPQRRRYEEPLSVRVRRQLLSIAESPHKRAEDDVHLLAKTISDNYDDEDLRATFFELTLQIVTEQPFKIPFVAAVVVVLNGLNRGEEAVQQILVKAATSTEIAIVRGQWRAVKLLLKFLGCLQGLLEDDGVFGVLTELFERAVDLQTASSDDTLGTELVKVILFTIPYIMASSSTDSQEHAASILDKTDIVASSPHPLEALVNPYPGNGKDEAAEPTSVISLLQKQLQTEAANGWELACLPRPWRISMDGDQELIIAPKHTLPPINVPETVNPGSKALFPEIFFSVYAHQEVETVPPPSDVASCLLRDSIIDTINILDFNRNATARFLIDIDCYFSPGTFVKRATPFDRLKDIEGDRSTWKPEDVAVDAVFSQLFQLPSPEHKLVYYHSVLTEACKIAPAAIAPSLGRAIRYLYRNVDQMDLELSYRFMDWFAHHLSNFGFTWKWTEWIDDVNLPTLHPKKAFIQGALDKEIRLSFAQRIKGTLPEPYQPLISEAKEKDVPDFKYNDEGEADTSIVTPFSAEGKELHALLRRKASEEEIQAVIDKINSLANTLALDPILCSTDAYVTSICFIGSKSLSHALSCIERCKDRLLAIGNDSEAGRRQIITSVMAYWADQPGVGVNIVDKLLNYTILNPSSVIQWALVENAERGDALAYTYIFEMVASTIAKVTNRIRQVVHSRNAPGLPADQKSLLEETVEGERRAMKELGQLMDEALLGWATGSKDQMMESGDGSTEAEALIRQWGERWLKVFRRQFAVEEAWGLERDREARERPKEGAVKADIIEMNGNGNGMDIEADV
ncbi:MAG: hypothetical protein M1818_000048 [Claussenomyces sp. TS43310]|nr:MAG: hypothetical protein M1818_000048 [Claussenomyces sp. TS43310]